MQNRDTSDVMRNSFISAILGGILFVVLGSCTVFEQVDDPSTGPSIGILVVSLTPDYRHESIPAGNRALRELGTRIAESDSVSEVFVDIIDSEGEHAATPPTEFPTEASRLSKYDVIVFNNSNDATSPNSTETLVLSPDQEEAFKEYVRSGGGVVGIHSAIDNQTAGSFFSHVFGTYYEQHASFQEGTIHVTDRVHPSTDHLPTEWEVTSEWYTFQATPRGESHILMTADETSYDGKQMDDEAPRHPMAWAREVAGGRAWYTALGHAPDLFDDEKFRTHLLGGIRWAAGLAGGRATGTVWNAYTKTPLATDTQSPTTLEVTPDGRVFYVDRRDYNNDSTDAIISIDPETNARTTVLELPVDSRRLNGLKGMVLDPEFEKNGWIYLFYGPRSGAIEEPHNRLSRFTVSNGTIDRSTETEILRVPMQRQVGGHIGGDLAWGPDGRQLYLSLGDDTYCCDTDYAPLDERDGRAGYDAQRTSANTADLRGSILRIVPLNDGSYLIPEGNLFTEANGYQDEIEDGRVRPEIYVMGMRNPYRITVDETTGTLYWGDYGPDAGSWDAERGPLATVEYNRAGEPGFYGWPYFTGENIPYKHYNFETDTSGRLFSAERPINGSANNTGLKELPPAEGSMIPAPHSWEAYLEYPSEWSGHVSYDRLREVPFPQLAGGAPMQGPVYYHKQGHDDSALPRYYNGKAFILERGQNWIKYITFGKEGRPVEVEPFLPGVEFKRPMDLTVGPDGALYLAEWGSEYGAPNEDSGIYRIAAHQSSKYPVVSESTATPTSSPTPSSASVSDTSSLVGQGTSESEGGPDSNSDGDAVAKTFTLHPEGNQLKYRETEFTVSSGTKVKVVFENTATAPRLKHNVVLLNKPPLDRFFRRVGQAAMQAEGFVPDDPAVLASTPLAKPGETVSVTFTVPEEVGDYGYVCTFTGHWATMQGTMHVIEQKTGADE